MGITTDVGHRAAIAWAPHATEPWVPAPVAVPRLESLPTAPPPRWLAPARTAGQPSRMVAIAQVLATWRAAEHRLAPLLATDPEFARAEAAVLAARADYHRLFAEHRARQQGTTTL